MQQKQYKLNFQFVPDSCWYSNLRTLMPDKWQKIRRRVVALAGGRCGICGMPCSSLHAHEQWEYDLKNCVQRLVAVVAVCPACHAVIHYGRTSLKGDAAAAERHFMQVNGCSYAEMRAALGRANDFHAKCNAVAEWKLDVTAALDYLK